MRMKALIAVAASFIFVVALACAQEQSESTKLDAAVNLTFVGEITNKSDGTMYLGNGGRVYVNVPQGKFRIHPLVRVIDAHDGKELASRDFNDVPCSSGFTMDVWAVIPNSGNVVAEGCKHVYVLDGTNLEVKRELSSKDPKLWSSRFAVAPDGKSLALIEVFETKAATRSITRLFRTIDWQDEGGWDGSGPSYYSADAKRLLVRNPPGIQVRRLPDGKPESFIEGGAYDPLIAIDVTDSEEIRLIEHETGTVWNANLGNGRVKQGPLLENWPKVVPHSRISVSPDGSWLCAPTAQQLQENTPAFAIWSTRTGKILIKGESLVLSPQEKRDATHGITGGYASCQVAGDGKFIMLRAGFGDRSARARIYEIVQRK